MTSLGSQSKDGRDGLESEAPVIFFCSHPTRITPFLRTEMDFSHLSLQGPAFIKFLRNKW